MILHTRILLHPLHLLDACASCLRVGILATDRRLRIPHAGVKVNVFDRDPKRAVCWALEPTVDLPNEVQEDEQRASEVKLEESAGIEVRASDGVESYVELGDESETTDEHTDV